MALTRAATAGAALCVLLAGPASARDERWTPGWGSAQQLVEGRDAQQITRFGAATIRQIVRLTAGGRSVRVQLSNVAGREPLRIGAATVARGVPGHAAVAQLRTLTFAGAASIVIPPGAELLSDPVVGMTVAAGGDVAVSIYLPQPVASPTGHPGARATTFLIAGDATMRPDVPGAQRIGGWWNLAAVEVAGGAQTAAVVAIGDSITDGRGIRDDSNARWPDLLARRLAADPRTRRLAVVNAGIGGNRVLLDGAGPNLLARFDRDVIARPAVRYAIVLEGVNDLGTLTRDGPASPAQHRALVSAITGAYRQLAARAHAHGIAVLGGTITPFVGNDYYHAGPANEADRQAINAFIRTGHVFDGVIDFDRAVRDRSRPDRLRAEFDSGDHLHPSDAGYRAMADAVPPALFAAGG